MLFVAKNSLITYFESIDKTFKNHLEIERKYKIKSYHKRTILIMFD